MRRKRNLINKTSKVFLAIIMVFFTLVFLSLFTQIGHAAGGPIKFINQDGASQGPKMGTEGALEINIQYQHTRPFDFYLTGLASVLVMVQGHLTNEQ